MVKTLTHSSFLFINYQGILNSGTFYGLIFQSESITLFKLGFNKKMLKQKYSQKQ